jgi:predicted transcriptional regulator
MSRPRLEHPRRPYCIRLSPDTELPQLHWLAEQLDMTESATIRQALDSLADSVKIANKIIGKREK